MPPHAHQDGSLDPALRLQPGQQHLTPAQEAEARRFAEASIQRQLSTEPVDEQEAEAWLRQVYERAGLPSARIQWVDGPLQLVRVLMDHHIEEDMRERVWSTISKQVAANVRATVAASLFSSVEEIVWNRVKDRVRNKVWEPLLDSVWDSVGQIVGASVEVSFWQSVGVRVWASVEAYDNSYLLAFYRFFDRYLAPHDLSALAHFNEMVSGYWLGKEIAMAVRHPKVLALDAQGRLHSETGTCMEYHDGWGFSARHGMRVPGD
jgi:hypothetical protein